MPDTDEFPALFECPNHQGGLMLTPATCASMWERARRSQADALIRLAPCVGCQVGASNAGVPVRPESPAQQAANALTCVRCGQSGARRLIGGRLCVSCFNRQREYEIGRNAKGGPPSQHRPLYCAIVGVVTDTGAVQPLQVDMVGGQVEALLTISRATGSARFGRVPPGATAAPCPALPRRKGTFALLKTPA